MKRIKYFIWSVLFLSVIIMAPEANAYIIPENDSRIRYFYVFGPQGNPDYGAEADHELTFYIDLPEDAADELSIDIFDPDTGGKLDFRGKFGTPWDTITEFVVYGSNNGVLDTKRLGEDREFDHKYFRFGPYLKSQGQKIGDIYRFRLDVKALAGSNGNLFNVRISPDNARAFTYKIAFRLLGKEGEEMFLYPEIPSGTTQISAENFDLDIDGATSTLYDPETRQHYKITDSLSALWAKTPLTVSALQPRRLKYIMRKKTQRHGNAAVQFRDEKNNLLPIYFQEDKSIYVPLPAEEVPSSDCRIFTFDATESYDPNDQQLSYHWNFGDGTTSTEPIVTHKYENSGQYTTVLSVKNTSGLNCDTAVTSEVVTVNSPPQAAFISQEIVCQNQEIIFDASPTIDNTPDQLTYHWDFGDGTTAEGKRVDKAYQKSGIYRVQLKVNDNAGTSCSVAKAMKNITVNAPPVIGSIEDIDMCIPLDQEYKVAFNFIENQGQARGNLKYTWDFGDGTTAVGKNVTHVYKHGGEYKAQLTADDGLGLSCSVGSTTFNVRLNKQPKARAGESIVGCFGQAILFDGSRSEGENKEDLTYTWDFGDGTPNVQGVKADHVYTKPGNYKARLTLLNSKSRKSVASEDSISVLVNIKPAFTLSEVKNTCVGKKIEFATLLKTNEDHDLKKDALKYTWDFGDGTVIQGGANIEHTYLKGGEYLVKVKIDDQLGTACSVDIHAIKVKVNTLPVANSGPNLVCCTDVKSVFDGSVSSDPDGDVLTYTWDFGDDNIAKGAQVTHVYKKRGKYKVTLKVDDNSGTECSSSVSRMEVSVSEKPVSVMKVR